jgi:hypothetical protein
VQDGDDVRGANVAHTGADPRRDTRCVQALGKRNRTAKHNQVFERPRCREQKAPIRAI